MKIKLMAVLLAGGVGLGLGAASVAADTSVVVTSNTSVDGGTSGACASQTTLLQVNGSPVVDRTDSACTP